MFKKHKIEENKFFKNHIKIEEGWVICAWEAQILSVWLLNENED